MFKVKDCLKAEYIKVSRGTPLREIVKLFEENELRILPVTDNSEKVAGVITLEELTSVFQPQAPHLSRLIETVPFIETVAETELSIEFLTPEMGILVIADEIMSLDIIKVKPEDSVSKAFSEMKANGLNELVVADEENTFAGVISLFDIIYSVFLEKGVIPR